MELTDIYNKNWEKTGRIIDRHDSSITLSDEEYILVIGCWVFNSKKQILLTKRSPEKKFAPNHFLSPKAYHERKPEATCAS